MNNMTTRLHRILITLIGGFLAFGTTAAWAAKAPVSPENLKKNADHIVSGTVVAVSSKTQKSKVEKSTIQTRQSMQGDQAGDDSGKL